MWVFLFFSIVFFFFFDLFFFSLFFLCFSLFLNLQRMIYKILCIKFLTCLQALILHFSRELHTGSEHFEPCSVKGWTWIHIWPPSNSFGWYSFWWQLVQDFIFFGFMDWYCFIAEFFLENNAVFWQFQFWVFLFFWRCLHIHQKICGIFNYVIKKEVYLLQILLFQLIP